MSLTRLNRLPGRYLILQYALARRSPALYKQWEVACTLLNLSGSQPKLERLWCPFSEIGFRPPMSQVGRQPGRISPQCKPIRRTFKGLKNTDEWQDGFTPRWKGIIDLFQPRRTVEAAFDLNGPMHTLEDANGERIAVPSIEFGRFYLASVPSIASALFECTSIDGQNLDHLMDPVRSTWSGNRFDAYPRRTYCGLSSVLQMTAATIDVELNFYLQYLAASVRKELRVSETGALTLPRANPRDLVVDGYWTDYPIEQGKPPRQTFVVLRIVSDLRKPPVEEIVVHYPFSAFPPARDDQFADEDVPKDEEEADEPLPTIGIDTEIGRKDLPGNKTIYLKSMYSRLTTSFPGWAKSKVTYDYREPPDGIGEGYSGKRPREASEEASEASVSTPTPSGTLPHLVTTTANEQLDTDRPEDRAREPQEFVREDPPSLVSFEICSFRKFSKKMRTFLAAGVDLINFQDLHWSPNVPGKRDEGVVLTLPAEWGGIASPTRRGWPRRAVALPLMIGHTLVWVAEIERRAEYEKIAMGLFASHRTNMDPLDLLNSVLFNVCRRTAGKQVRSHKGLWPDADYLDVKLTSLIHSPKRVIPANLAADIYDRARILGRASLSP